MRVKTLSIGLLLFAVLAVYPVSNVSAEMDSDVINAALPGLVGFISVALASSPAAPFLVAGLGLLHVLSMILLGSGSTDELTKNDLSKTRDELMNKLNEIDAHISDSTSKIINELSYKIESHTTLEEMRKTLEIFNTTYNENMSDILDPQKPEATRIAIAEMTNNFSRFRNKLSTFITNYIKPKRPLPASEPIKLFFEFILRKNELLASENEDCHQDSVHYKIFKSYIYIAKVLTDAYVMVLSGYVVRYQEQLSPSKAIEAASTKKKAKLVLESFKRDMNVLMQKTTWALENSSRDIKNCGSFELKEGVNYARLPFVTTVVRFKTIFTHGLSGFSKCIDKANQPVSLSNYHIVRWNIAKKWIPLNSNLDVYYNPSDLERPFSHAKFDGTTRGHADRESSLSTQTETGYCSPDFLYAYHKKTVGISTQRVGADPGNVITGVRFRVSKNVLYIDIQQGKFISDLEVDPDTVHWKETPENPSQVGKLAPYRFNKIEIADLEVKDGKNLTAIQIVEDSAKLFRLQINSQNNALPAGGVKEHHEIKLDDGDDPAKIANGTIRLISRHPDPNYAYIKFQVSSFEKDLSRTTIPYIDTREVVTNPPSPVVGIGIYHEASKGDGGLLALKLIQPRLTKYVNYTQVEQFAKPEVVAINRKH